MPSGPMVGRGEELRFIVEGLEGPRAGGVVVAGAPGVGKTRLAREAAAVLERSVAVERLAATASAAQIPFGALAHLTRDATVRKVDDRLRIVQGIRSALEAKAAGRPLVLVVDDAQWLDPGAAALVHQLVVSGVAKLLLTVRTWEPAPEPIVACWKDGWTERLELQPLNAHDVAELATIAVGGPVDQVTVRRLWTLSEGNPLFLHEVIRAAIEARAFTCCDGVWSWVAPVGTSDRLAQILESRLTPVPAASRRVLDLLAVGEPLPCGVVTDVHGAEAVVELERLGLVVADERDPDAMRVCHPLYSELLLAAMGGVERRRVTAQLADAMVESAQDSPAMRLRIAMWRLDGGTATSPEALTDAAEIASGLDDLELAERLARRAVTNGAGLRARLVLGDSLSRQGRTAEGLAVLDPLPDEARTDDERVAVAAARYFALTSEFGFRAEFAEVLIDAERRAQDPRSIALLRAQRAALLCSAGELERGVALAQRTIEEHPDELVELRAGSALGSVWMCSGRTDAACAMTERLLELAGRVRLQIPQAAGWIVTLHLPGLVLAGRLDDADDATAAVEAMAVGSRGSTEAAAFIALARGLSALQRGQVRQASQHLRESVALLRPIARWRLPFALVQLAEALALTGDASGAAAASEEADDLVANHAIFEGGARRARGWVALARGERSTAIDLLLDAAEWSGAHGQHTAELFALHDAVRFGAVREARDRIHDVGSRSEGRWAPVMVAHAEGLANRDGRTLLSVATSFEELGARLLAAEACAHAVEAFTADGLRTRVASATARASRLAASCENARSPVLDELERPLPLTRREREVADLAAAGLSSHVIAERLFLSVRTVEGHLQNAYGKLGVHDRVGLARLVASPTPGD